MPRIQAGSIQLNYETFGQGDPLLLIMGFGMPGAAWAPMLPFLGGFKCIYFDNRGTGTSDKPEGPYTVPQMADDAANLLTALDIPKAKIYGISMGGMIAQELMLRHPEKVEKAVLGCTMAGGATAVRAPEDVLRKLVEGSSMMAANAEAGLDIIMPLLFPVEFIGQHPELKQLLLAGMKMAPPTPPESIQKALAGVMDFDAYDRLPQIRNPVMIVHGDADVLVPPQNAALLKKRIPHADVFMIPGAGHSYAAIDPVGIHQRITTWLKS
jgi:pimeloyl-ACP methyl ester carboxylesterase